MGNIEDILLAMAVVVMISSGIAIMLALYNSMEQRRRQIAVLRVLGSSRGRIFGLIVTESAGLVSPPGVCLQVFELLQTGAASAADFGDAIARDPSLTARLLGAGGKAT